MRRILLIGLFSLALASCTAIKKTSTSVYLTPSIVQIPTVYELKVSEQMVSKDTTWVWSPFSKDQSSLKDVTSCLMASIIRNNQADVLVEPQQSLKTVKGFCKKTYKLQITGFPAKYINFHTITKEEYDMLYGPRLTMCDSPTSSEKVDSLQNNRSKLQNLQKTMTQQKKGQKKSKK